MGSSSWLLVLQYGVVLAWAHYSPLNSSISRVSRRVHFPSESRASRADSGVRSIDAECDSTIREEEGWIFTPNYPSDYDNYRTCAYTVERFAGDVCSVQMTIVDFDVEETDGCFSDYLDLREGQQDRICGTLAANTKKTLRFPVGQRTMTLRFRSDGQSTRKGFMIQIRQLRNSCRGTVGVPGPGSCNLYVDTFSAKITSPSFPASYEPNQRCVYTIRRADHRICQVTLESKLFDLEGTSTGCSKDYLELPDRTRLCGSRPVARKILEFPEGSDILTLIFVSDSYGTERGFEIDILQVPDSCGGLPAAAPPTDGQCDQELSVERGRLISPGFPRPYGPNERCRYTIRRAHPSVCKVELEAQQFDMEFSGGRCTKDYLVLPDHTRLCSAFSGRRVLNFPKSTDYLTMYFISDDYGFGNGFDLSVRQAYGTCEEYPTSGCTHTISGRKGRITSPGYPRPYGPSIRCQYTIRRPDLSTCLVELTARSFDVEYSGNCDRDHLELPDRTRLCGNSFRTKIFDYASYPEDTMIFFFISNNARAGNGFDIEVNQVPNSCSVPPPAAACDQTITSDTTVISSPNYPTYYPRNVRCTYTIHRLSLGTCHIQLDFLDFDVEETRGCIADYLEIGAGDDKMCGARPPFTKVVPFETGSDTLKLVFSSDKLTTRRGFKTKMTQLKNSCYRPIAPDTQVCDTLSVSQGFIQSANFPRPYNPNTDCAYKIRRTSNAVCQVEFFFVQFDVAKDTTPTCNRDYLEILGTRYCGGRSGQRVLVDFPYPEEEMAINFKTDAYDQATGFRIEVKQLTSGCPSPPVAQVCDQEFTEEKFQVISPAYQEGSYPANSDCKYTVKKFAFDVCAIEIKYYTFDLEESEDCSKDYLEIGDHRVCGRMEYDSTRSYDFPEDELVIVFHTDSSGGGTGFFLSGSQVKC